MLEERLTREFEDNSYKSLNKFPYICFDNFYKNPDYVREFALSNEFHHNDGRWPGKRTKLIHEIDRNFYEKFCAKMLALFFPLDKSINYTIDTAFQLVEQMDDNTNSPKNKGWIHFDAGVLFAGLIYLSPNAVPENGTSIYEVINPDTINHSESKIMFYRDGVDVQHDLALEIHNSSFRETVRFNNIYNRFISFPAEAWHGVNNFSNPSGEPRLTQVFFVKRCISPYMAPIMRCNEQNDL